MGILRKEIFSRLAITLCLFMHYAFTQTQSPESQNKNALAQDRNDSLTLELSDAVIKIKQKKIRPLEVKTEFLNKIPNTMNDPIRSLSFLPGVTVQSDLNVRPYVRGGNSDQTQVVKNGIPLLQPYHVGGVFSVFNSNTIESIHLYRENFPVATPGALSGIVELTPTSPNYSDLHLQTHLSLLRGDLFAEAPLVKGRLGAYVAAQSFLLNNSLHGLLNLSSGFSNDSLYQQDLQGYRDHINLPAFQDYTWGTSLRVNEQLEMYYSGSFSTDDYTVVIPTQANIITRRADPGSPSAIVPVLPKKEISRSKKLSIDSISAVDIKNQSHFLTIPWDVNSENFVENNLGFQSQVWNVDFKKAINIATTADPLMLSQSTREFNYRLSNTYSPSDQHQFKMGLSYDYKLENYKVTLPYVLYDIIVNSNLDMLEGLGYFTDRGFAITKEDSSKSNFDYLGGYPSRIRFSHTGQREEHFGSLFFSHQYKTSTGTLEYGVRGEYQNTSKEFFPAPRISYTYNFNEANDFKVSGGVYSQNTLPYFERDQNPTLKSEKSTQTAFTWTHRFNQGYRLEANSYYKYFYDLVTPSLVPNHKIDLSGILLPNPASTLSANEIANLKATLDTTTNFGALPDSIQNLSYQVYGDLIFNYANSGIGNSYGSEFSFFYNPYSKWKGWASVDLSISNRKDAQDRPAYPYRYHRPLIFNWVNYFQIPGNFDIAFTYRYALGQSYTPYSGTLDGSGSFEPIQVGARNSGRLAPYSRLDLRLTKNSQLWSRELKYYVEVWNSMNDPNYFARDSQTGELKSAQLNWPFPLLFLGISYQI